MNREGDDSKTLARRIAEAAPTGTNAQLTRSSFAGNRYLVERLLGEGGQKLVYLARDTLLDRRVVISLLKTDRTDALGLARIQREARAMGRLGDHLHTVTVYDAGEESGQPYIVSQYVEGGSVEDLIKEAAGRPLALDQVLRIADHLCQALDHAHGLGIVHRDLKPANILLTKNGEAKLGDFGLARALDLSRMTMEGVLIGTVAYMPPEQALGRQADARSDLYALGAVLYEMVTGRAPFLGDGLVAILSQHIQTPPVAPSWYNPEVPPALEELILQLLAKAPEERLQSASATRERLLAISSSESALAERVVHGEARSLDRLAGGVFVGREQETAELRRGLNDAFSGRGRLVLLSGEPGSGKTRMTEELGTYARLRNAHVLVGRCYEGEGAPAFWPWVQIIRAYVQGRQSGELLSVMGSGAAEIARLNSEILERLPGLPPPAPLKPEQGRFRLFDSVTTFLKNVGKAQPLVLVLDDLHWADKASLLLLQFLAREMAEARLLVIGTYRDVELGRQHPLAQTLGDLARAGLSQRIFLGGLGEQDVFRFIEMTAGFKPSEKLAAAVHGRTEGNPFFVKETVRLLVAEGRLDRSHEMTSWTLALPQGVREVVTRRLDQLSKDCHRLLRIASVVGREFGVDVLEPASRLSGDRLLDALDEAVAARLLLEMPRGQGHYGFSHALIRETLYEDLRTTQRVRLHRQIGEVLESIHRERVEPYLAELAHHFVQAGTRGSIEKAVSYAVRAAERANNLLAYEEAVKHYELSLEALKLKQPPDKSRECELLLSLGTAQSRTGEALRARETFLRAAEMARHLHAPHSLAQAALGLSVRLVETNAEGVDAVQVELLDEALGALGEEPSGLRARLLAQKAMAFYYTYPLDARASFCREAIEMARRVGDTEAEIRALYTSAVALEGSDKTAERLAAATEIVRLAEKTGDKELALRGYYRCHREHLELGDLPAADREMRAYAKLAEELRQPVYLWVVPFVQASRALLEGRFEECERLAMEALTMGRRAQDPNAALFFGVEMYVLRGMQGRYAEMEGAVRSHVEKYSLLPGWRATLTHLYSELQREPEARDEFERLAEQDFAKLPRDGGWNTAMASLAYACFFLGDTRRGKILYELLRTPFAGRNIISGNSSVYCGSASRYLGLLAELLSRLQEATQHFDDALAMEKRVGARPFLARNQADYARILLRRHATGDREKAKALLEESTATARELGMTGVLKYALALQGEV